jgi:hypothetical protein
MSKESKASDNVTLGSNIIPDPNETLPDKNQVLQEMSTELSDSKKKKGTAERYVGHDMITGKKIEDNGMVFTSSFKESSENIDIEQNKLPDKDLVLPGEIQNTTDERQDLEHDLPDKVKHICELKDDHRIQFLTEKSRSDWCKPNAMFHEVICRRCTKKFVHGKDDPETTVKPTVRKPMHVCPNEKHKCTFAYCHECFMLIMEELNKPAEQKDELVNDVEVEE